MDEKVAREQQQRVDMIGTSTVTISLRLNTRSSNFVPGGTMRRMPVDLPLLNDW